MSRVTVSVNGLSLVHENSGGVSTATLPDVCATPPTQAPVPYPNVARSRDLVGGSSLVRADGGHAVATGGSRFARSSGGEPGSGGGVSSGSTCAEASFLTHSFDVMIEGRGACRLTDKMLHNRGNTIDCAGVQQPPVGRRATARHRGPKRKKADRQAELANKRVHWEGVDTNLANAERQGQVFFHHAKQVGCKFVGRYIVDDRTNEEQHFEPGDDPAERPVYHPPLTKKEVARIHKAGLKVFAIWEAGKHRAKRTMSVERQFWLGQRDARRAVHKMKQLGADDKPVYFTVDFSVPYRASSIDPATKEEKGLIAWTEMVTDAKTNERIRFGRIILAYFRGIASVIGRDRTGAYGTYIPIKQLFKHNLIQYGWQMTFDESLCKPGTHVDKRAQLHQYCITPSQAGWGVNGLGALDCDLALRGDFGQW
jgi:hypothetical protein